MATTDGVSVDSSPTEDYSLTYAHGTVMVVAWMVFASTGILFARYGRSLSVGNHQKLLGETVWFQAHRLALTLVSVLTLLGFFLILSQVGGKWVSLADDGPRIFAHSILGAIIVGFTMIQVWMALFRCHPNSRFRFIFDWAHRTTGVLAFVLAIPTIFLSITYLSQNHNGLFTVISIWTAWIIIVIIICELLDYKSRRVSKSSTGQPHRKEADYELRHPTSFTHRDIGVTKENVKTDNFNRTKLILFGVHVVVVIALVIPFIVLIWKQD